MKIKPKKYHLTLSGNYLNRYEFIKTQSNGSTSIITDKIVRNRVSIITALPYKIPNNKIIAFLKFTWLRIKLHYS